MAWVRTLVAVLMVALCAVGPRVVKARCAQSCPDDDDSGQCAPGCLDCTCCSPAPSVVCAQPTRLRVPQMLIVEHDHDDTLPPSAELHELLDVPKLVAG